MGKTVNKTTAVKRLLSGHLRPPAAGGLRVTGLSGWLGVILLCGLLGFPACGELRPNPAAFEPQVYTPIEYQDLLALRQTGLHEGQKIRVQAYFWQYLDYDPAIVRNYLTLAKYPIRWYQLRWFATYGAPDLTGYFDLAAMTPEQADQYKLKRLEPIMLYGELARLGTGLYLQVFHIEKIVTD
jgi:hypothetical protein